MTFKRRSGFASLNSGITRNETSPITSVVLTPISLPQMSSELDYMSSHNSLSSQNSSLFSQNSFPSSQSNSLFCQTGLQSQTSLPFQLSIQSQMSMQSQVSLSSQASILSELSLYSQSSLGFLPSLANFTSQAKEKSNFNYHCIATLQGHNDPVSSIVLSGNLLYTGSCSNQIKVWLTAGFTECFKFDTGVGGIKALVIAGDRIFSSHQDHKIRIWKRSLNPVMAHKLMVTLPTVKDYLTSFIYPKNYVEVRRHKKRLWLEHVDSISVLAVYKSDVLYSGSWDKTVKVWRLSDFKCLESFKAHDDAVNCLVLSSDGFLYTGSADAKVKVWLNVAGEMKHSLVTTLDSHKSTINALALSPDDSILYSGACDRSIIVWEREDSAQHMTVAGVLRGHRHAVLCLATVNSMVCSGSADKTIRVWRRESGTAHSCLAVLKGHNSPVKCIAASMDPWAGYLVYSGSLDHDIKVWCVKCRTEDESLLQKTSSSVESELSLQMEFPLRTEQPQPQP